MDYPGLNFLTDFWRDKYLNEYIPFGGSKIKFITGRHGSGKTTLLNVMNDLAFDQGYRVASISADRVPIDNFASIYKEVLNQCDLQSCIQDCADEVVRRMGYRPEDIPSGYTFIDYLSSIGENNPVNKRAIRSLLKEMFLEDPYMDNNFALAFTLLTGGVLGYPALEEPNRDLLIQWLHGDPTVKIANLRALGLSPSRISKTNARHMLRSLSRLINIGNSRGLLVSVDNLDALSGKTGSDTVKYTKTKREDAYESIRLLIDDLDSMPNVMFLFAFDRSLMDDDRNGLRSYQALWMRIQNEVTGSRFNRFGDITDMDHLAAEVYTPELIMQISSGLAGDAATSLQPLSFTQAENLLKKSKTGTFGIPLLIKNAILGGSDHV